MGFNSGFKGLNKVRAELLTYLLTPCSRGLLEKLTGFQLVNNFQHFMEPKVSLPHSQVPTICPYPGPEWSSPCPTYHFLKIHLNIILPTMPGSSKWSPSLRFPYQNPVYTSPLPHTCYILLDLITRTIPGEGYRSLRSSLCSALHLPVTSSLLGPNILLSNLFSYTLSLRSSLSVSDQVLHPYKTRGKIIARTELSCEKLQYGIQQQQKSYNNTAINP